ncbi:MAG: hypothetical protein IJS50_06325 [Desulfovibrio sp.]|nr:hypothetical protein [Desulfovibrio sp.]
MAVVVLPVVSGLDFEHFVRLPWTIYQNAPKWVPPLLAQERRLLSPALHPFWQQACQRLFLAKRNGKIVGRIAAIIDHNYNNYVGERCGAFGFFECQNDQEAAQALVAQATKWLKNKHMQYLRGPVNPSTNYTCGLLVAGFEHSPALMMPWNPPYYPTLLENCGLHKEEYLFAYRIFRHHLHLDPALAKHLSQKQKSDLFSVRKADRSNLAVDIATMLELYRQSWAKNWYFSPLSQAEEKELVHELVDIVDPDFFVLFFHKDQPAAGMVALPDLNPLLQRLNGKIGPSLPWHYLRTRSSFHKHLRIMLFGILEEYRLLGLPALLFNYMLELAKAKPELEWVEGSWVLEDNHAICELIEDFSGSLTMRYRIYRKELDY